MAYNRHWKHCPLCGGGLVEGDDGERKVPRCEPCDRFFYSNPVPCVTAILETAQGILLILRGKEPKAGSWALPGGFLDVGEDPAEGARREFEEETGLKALDLSLLGLTSQHSRRFGTVIYAGYEVRSFEGELAPGTDAVEARFFPRGELPEQAFESLEAMVRLYLEKHPRPPGP